jgi:putative acetyltransferase
MIYATTYADRTDEIAALFTSTFSDSEGAEEGVLIGDLVRRLMADTPPADLRVFTAWDGDALVGGIFFSPLVYAGDTRRVVLLSPVAVATGRQGEGIGQRLIARGLDALRQEGVEIAVTYGDPGFYGRVGFLPVPEADVPAPHNLQHPQGWLARSLTDTPLTPLRGPVACATAFNDPALW